MALPKYNEMYNIFLEEISDGKPHAMKEIQQRIAQKLALTEEELAQRISSGQSAYKNHIGWTKTYLKKAGLLDSPARAQYVITAAGKALLKEKVAITNELLTEKYSAFAEFIRPQKAAAESQEEEKAEEETETPQETLERMYQAINEELAEELLAEILNQTPAFFESLVVDLMGKMNYGKGFVTKVSGDDGIDGIIPEDKLGFSLIYIQAKRWKPETTIGKPEIQKFAGAMMGPPKVEKGLFITTAKFSQGAKDYAEVQHIILVDGKKLTKLMIDHGVGVSDQKTYRIKRIDSDYFSDN